ncbi:MAG: M56 family metallopeptidase [Owenweeksia sp.]
MKLFIINTILFSGIYYGLYVLLFRKQSFLQLNRLVLLMIPLLSIGIPLVAPFYNDPVLESTGFSTTLLPVTLVSDAQASDYDHGFSGYWSWQSIYYAGILFSIIPFALGLLRVYSIVRQSEPARWGNLNFLLSSKADSPFAFFQSIVIPTSLKDHPDLKTVLNHEEVHRHQLHSADNIYYNVLGIIFWFNPFIHLLARELRQTHECLADQKALKETSREVYARMLLSSTFGKEWSLPMTIGTVNPFFNSSLLKTRITMLYKKESPKWLRTAYWAMLPLALAMTLHACNKSSEKGEEAATVSKTVSFEEVEQPPLFKDCDTEASIDEQKVCFHQGIIRHLQENLKYPEEAEKAGLEGKVFVEFVTSKSGEVTAVKVVRGIALDEDASQEMKEAAKQLEDRAVLLISDIPNLKPARVKGKNVAMKLILPISFKLS